MKIVDKPWGREVIIVNNDKYCGKILEIYKGKRLSKQRHTTKTETLYVYDGKIDVFIDNVRYRYNVGESITIVPGQVHRIEALENSEIFEISTHHNDDDTVRIEDDFGRMQK